MAVQFLNSIDGVSLIGASEHNAGVLAFTVKNIHPHDVGTILDNFGVAIRTGNHCAEPLMHRFGVPATCRASLCVYNTTDDIDSLADAIKQAITILG